MTNDLAGQLATGFIAVDDELEREFEARVADSSALAFRVAYGVLRHRENAEDVAQEAFAKAYRTFRQLRDRERFRAWLVRMTWRLALNRRRGDCRRLLRETRPVEGVHESAIDVLLSRERAEQLWDAIDRLPDKLRIVVVLAGIEGHDLAEVARLLGLPVGTVKSRFFLGRQRLKDALQWTRTK